MSIFAESSIRMKKNLIYIDLFAGAGGLSEGFINAGFLPVAHIEMDKAACYTLRTRAAYHYLKTVRNIDHYVAYLKSEINREQLYANVPKEILSSVINLPIGKANNDKIFKLIDERLRDEKVDLIIGGPPCQAYSLVGRARSHNGMEGDERNFLFMEYAKFLHWYKPKMFVFENVTGLHSANKGAYLRKMLLMFRNLGYEIRDFVLAAKDFDVLQDRKRIILIGYRKDMKLKAFDLKGNSNNYTVSVLLNDLPVLQAGQGLDKYTGYVGPTNEYLQRSGIRGEIPIVSQHLSRAHSIQDKQIYRIAIKKWNEEKERLNYNDLPEALKTHANRDVFTDRFKVVASDLNTSQTVVAHIAKDGHYYIHPDIKQCRSLTIREAARLQSFPDDYYFEGEKETMNRTAAFKQIGNAVPPLMARRIAEEIKKCL